MFGRAMRSTYGLATLVLVDSTLGRCEITYRLDRSHRGTIRLEGSLRDE